MEYCLIDQQTKADIRLKNEPFPLVGRMIPQLIRGCWSYTIEWTAEEEVAEMTFPDEAYDFEAMSANHVFIGAYEQGECVGLAILADDFFKYMYLEDLKVNEAYRRLGVGQGLIEMAQAVALERGYDGLWTIAQDNNVLACLFYLKAGFELGGFDDRIYDGTPQADKANLHFYKRIRKGN